MADRPFERAWSVIDRVLQALAIGLAVSITVAAWRNVSQGYDIWYYHLPFAARLAGIMDASAYAFSADNEARFAGFPLLAEVLQGLVWRLTGHVEATNLVALASLLAIPAYLKRVHGVPPHLAFLALFAIPLVHIHATSSYVDLPANACVTLLLLGVQRALADDAPPSPRSLATCAALAAAAANTKFQLVPIVGVAAATLLAIVVLRRRADGAFVRRIAVFVVALPIVFATPIKNTVVHGNPVWPVELHVLGHAFPHVEDAYSQSPPHLRGASRPIRFVRSVLEVDNRPIAGQARWSLDQYAPPDDPSCRMGGYFGGYVVVQLVALALAWRRRKGPAARRTRAAVAVFGGATVVAALVPQSHELRYYMHWMLLLVSTNLVLFVGDSATARTRAAVAAVALGALVVVVGSTSAGFLYPSGSTFAQFMTKRCEASVVESAAPGERLCISREPFTFLYAPAFHGRKNYRVQEATRESDCKDARRVP